MRTLLIIIIIIIITIIIYLLFIFLWTRALLVGKPLKSLNRTNSLSIQRTRKKLRSAERWALVNIGEKKRKNASSRLKSTITHPKTSEVTSTGLSTSSFFPLISLFFHHAVLSWASASTGTQELWLPTERTLCWLLSRVSLFRICLFSAMCANLWLIVFIGLLTIEKGGSVALIWIPKLVRS